jgi:hypothetical protein
VRYDDVKCVKIGDIDYITKRVEKDIEEEERLSRIDKVKVKVKRNDRYKKSKGRGMHGGSVRRNSSCKKSKGD